MSTQPPPVPGPPPGAPVPSPPMPSAGSLRCPRCSAAVGPDQDWCLECGAPARTRLAPTPNWQLPTVTLGAIVLVAGALFAFAFVKLTDDGDAPASAPATITTAAPAVAPPVVAPPVVTGPTSTTIQPTPGQATTPVAPATPGQATTPVAPATPGQTTTPTRPRTNPRQTTTAPPPAAAP